MQYDFISFGVMAQEPNTLALANTKLIRNIPYVVNGHKLQNLDLYVPKDVKKPMEAQHLHLRKLKRKLRTF